MAKLDANTEIVSTAGEALKTAAHRVTPSAETKLPHRAKMSHAQALCRMDCTVRQPPSVSAGSSQIAPQIISRASTSVICTPVGMGNPKSCGRGSCPSQTDPTECRIAENHLTQRDRGSD